MPKKVEFSNSQISDIIALYTDGLTVAEVARKLEVSNPTVHRVLKENNVTMRPRGRRPTSHTVTTSPKTSIDVGVNTAEQNETHVSQ